MLAPPIREAGSLGTLRLKVAANAHCVSSTTTPFNSMVTRPQVNHGTGP
jgi:hypothetical protein